MVSYTPVPVSDYNTSPPPDDGSETEPNRLKWATIKAKISDSIKDATETIDDNIAVADAAIVADTTTANGNYNATAAAVATRRQTYTAPQNTATVFKMTTPPTGWTKSEDHDNKSLRLVNGTISTGGTTPFTDVFSSRTIAATNMPTHTHAWADSSSPVSLSRSSWLSNASVNTVSTSAETGGTPVTQSISVSRQAISATGSVSGTTGSAGSGTGWNFAVRYADIIIATKD